MKELSKSFTDNFDWALYPEAEDFLKLEINKFIQGNKEIAKFSKLLKSKTSTELFDWVDHLVLSETEVSTIKLKELGFKEANGCYRIVNSTLFPIVIADRNELALKVENIVDFKKANSLKSKIFGNSYSPIRKIIAFTLNGFTLCAVERRGYNGFSSLKTNDLNQYKKALDEFSKRKRYFKEDSAGFEETKKLVDKHLAKLSKSRVADAFFRSEREYWQKKNRAGQIQYKRQNSLGLGWGNHDHHTYRSSRENFKSLISLFESMGYKCRERFYAGEKAGWGAQILEHPDCDIVLFSDVDITDEEKDTDFAHVGLKHLSKLGTVGLWIGLHGESILQAGMHHLEARFSFELLENDLKKLNIEIMNPFSNFEFLKQAFTKGENWNVKESRLNKLLKEGSIDRNQYALFLNKGAIGSHMENLQRRQGYKGFNQNSVTAIIKKTNPLKQINSHQSA